MPMPACAPCCGTASCCTGTIGDQIVRIRGVLTGVNCDDCSSWNDDFSLPNVVDINPCWWSYSGGSACGSPVYIQLSMFMRGSDWIVWARLMNSWFNWAVFETNLGTTKPDCVPVDLGLTCVSHDWDSYCDFSSATVILNPSS